MKASTLVTAGMLALGALLGAREANADPCGMVPPVYLQKGTPPIERAGLLKTYVFYKDGFETFIIRAGYKGRVDNFGMLISFPTPPSLRKIPDDVFAHITAAIDPPEVTVDLRPRVSAASSLRAGGDGARSPTRAGGEALKEPGLKYDEVRVVRQEAVGMYEVAVLEAGSPAALKKWMEQHKFVFPTGMDKACAEYIEAGWCFLAVKAKIGTADGAAPKPGMKSLDNKLPEGASFDGHVQAMGFRFKTDELVVPMRLSAFNAGETRNIVYLLSDKPSAAKSFPIEMVRRQISGEQLYLNLTQPLPLRIIGGEYKDIPEWQKNQLSTQRNPAPHNGIARDVFAADLLAAKLGRLSHPFEEAEKHLLSVSERLGLRGNDIDKLHTDMFKAERDRITDEALAGLLNMTLTVIDGEFAREKLAAENVQFISYDMPSAQNTRETYDTNTFGKRTVRLDGQVWVDETQRRTALTVARSVSKRFGMRISTDSVKDDETREAKDAPDPKSDDSKKTDAEKEADMADLTLALEDPAKAEAAVTKLVAYGAAATPYLLGEAVAAQSTVGRGWAIIALGEIGGEDADQGLRMLHEDSSKPMLIRTWAAAARVQMAKTQQQFDSLIGLVPAFPALSRPVVKRVLEQMKADGDMSPESLLAMAARLPALQQAVDEMVAGMGVKAVLKTVFTAKNQNIRLRAAGIIGGMAANDKTVASDVAAGYAYVTDSTEVLWSGGPLYVPSLKWEQTEARELLGNLIAWRLFCERKDKTAELQQIDNNLGSIGLINVAGCQWPAGARGRRGVATVDWLEVYGKVVGRNKVEAILKAQGVEKDDAYKKLLDSLPAPANDRKKEGEY